MGQAVEFSNNRRLRELVEGSRLQSAVALTLFNRGLGQAACTFSQWQAYQADPGSSRHVELPDHLLAHAEMRLASLVSA